MKVFTMSNSAGNNQHNVNVNSVSITKDDRLCVEHILTTSPIVNVSAGVTELHLFTKSASKYILCFENREEMLSYFAQNLLLLAKCKDAFSSMQGTPLFELIRQSNL